MKIDSSSILQKILFCTRALTSTRDHQKPDDLLSKAKKQLDTYIKSLPKLKTLFQLEMNQFKAGNVKNKLPNWQKITKKELIEKN